VWATEPDVWGSVDSTAVSEAVLAAAPASSECDSSVSDRSGDDSNSLGDAPAGAGQLQALLVYASKVRCGGLRLLVDRGGRRSGGEREQGRSAVVAPTSAPRGRRCIT